MFSPWGLRGRGATLNTANRFEAVRIEPDIDGLDEESGKRLADTKRHTKIIADNTRSILSKVNSPDLGVFYSLNPYRGCEHGCIYCYARPSHEYLGFSAGVDFESRILVKHKAAHLLAKALHSPRWKPNIITLAGNTDCYQPIEKNLRITRTCLEVLLAYRNPVMIITKNALVLRDLDILQAMAKHRLVCVRISITTLNETLARKLEPRASLPRKRLETLRQLQQANVPTGVNVAPVIPGLNSHEMATILRQAAHHGASSAWWSLLRLPGSVAALFEAWLEHWMPTRKAKILDAVRAMRNGAITDARFGSRMRGEGVQAQMLARWFQVECERLCLNQCHFEADLSAFKRPHQALTRFSRQSEQQLAFFSQR